MKIEGVNQVAQVRPVQTSDIASRETKMQDEGKDLARERSVKRSVSEQEVIAAIEKANKALNIRYTSLQFSIHEETREIMVKVIDQESGEVIREIPPEKILDAVAKMWELAGLIVDEKA